MSHLNAPPTPSPKPTASLPITDVVPKPSIEGMPAGRVGMWALALGFGAFLLWAGFAPLDEGVPGQGVVTIDTKSKAVQHLSGGIVKEVLGASLKVFSLRTTDFSSEVGAVKHYISFFPSPEGEGVRRTGEVTFFAYFFASRQKSQWGAGLAPIKIVHYFLTIT